MFRGSVSIEFVHSFRGLATHMLKLSSEVLVWFYTDNESLIECFTGK